MTGEKAAAAPALMDWEGREDAHVGIATDGTMSPTPHTPKTQKVGLPRPTDPSSTARSSPISRSVSETDVRRTALSTPRASVSVGPAGDGFSALLATVPLSFRARRRIARDGDWHVGPSWRWQSQTSLSFSEMLDDGGSRDDDLASNELDSVPGLEDAEACGLFEDPASL
jgi:hypothetical protein